VLGRVPLTTPARTLLDLAATAHPDELVVLIDAALASGGTRAAELDQVAAWAARRRGVRRFREAVTLAHPGSRSPKETELRLILVRAGLPCPVPNDHVYDEFGGWIATADLLYGEHRIVLEYDGRDHAREERRLADLRRRNLLERAGYFVLAYSAADLLRPGRSWPMCVARSPSSRHDSAYATRRPRYQPHPTARVDHGRVAHVDHGKRAI